MGHDLIEDAEVDYEDIVKHSCDEVAAIISWVSDDKRIPSLYRHKNYMNRLSAAPMRAHIVKLADLYDNCVDSFDLFKKTPTPIEFLKQWHNRSIDLLNCLAHIKHIEYFQKVKSLFADLKLRIDSIASSD